MYTGSTGPETPQNGPIELVSEVEEVQKEQKEEESHELYKDHNSLGVCQVLVEDPKEKDLYYVSNYNIKKRSHTHLLLFMLK